MCDCQEKNSKIKPIKTSRRGFLKTVGASTLTLAAAQVPIFSSQSVSAVNNPLDLVDDALKIARKSSMLQEILDELKEAKIKFSVSKSSVKIAALNGPIFGCVLNHSTSNTKRLGADILLTVDFTQGELIFTQHIIGSSAVDIFNVSSIIFDNRVNLQPELRGTSGYYTTPPKMLRPRAEDYWAFSHPDTRPLREDEALQVGWPEEGVTSDYWHYQNISGADWHINNGLIMYRATEILESQTKKSNGLSRIVKLTYQDK